MNKIIDEDYFDYIIDNTLENVNNINGTNGNITYLNDRHLLIHVKESLEDMCNLGKIPYHRFPSLFTLNSKISLEKSGVGEVQKNPNLALYGQGVLVGIIDTGIDYLHPAFLNSGGNTKINSIWDQTIESEKKPEGFTFGTEYTKSEINIALSSDEPLEAVPTTDEDGHGTGIASIIAGTSDPNNNFSGVVPDSELIVVKLKRAKKNLYRMFCVPQDILCFQDSDVILGIRYLITKAKMLQRPLVICVAFGTSQGGHDGLGATSTYLTNLGKISKIGISTSAGNEGNKRRHFYLDATTGNTAESIEVNIGKSDKEFSLEIWSQVPARCALEIISPTGETTKMVYPSILGCQKFNFVLNQSTIWVNNFIFEEETGDQLMLIRFQNALTGIWVIRVTNLDEKPFSVNAWLPSGNIISNETFFIKANPFTTVTSPGNARSPLTVTAYNPFNDSFYLESSRGYTRSGLIKPDLAAPGYQIPCALVNGRYGTMSGTGAAAAHAAGIMAMILEWADVRGNYPSITGNDMTRLLIRGAYRKENIVYPNEEWGFGQIDVNQFFESLSLF